MNMSSIPLPVFSGKEMTFVATCYLFGSFTPGYYWVRWRTGQDIRLLGSGNVGARNVGRVLGPTAFCITLLLDVTKGVVTVAMANYAGVSTDGVVACILAVVAGHNWPPQLRFHGGKGVATSIGALLAFDSLTALVVLLVFLPLWALIRSFTLAGLVAFAIAPLVLFLAGFENPSIAALSFLAILMLITHRKNIREEFGRAFRTGKPSALRGTATEDGSTDKDIGHEP
jgi:glycerol-3-phosphate acyltransferase PlsY